MVLYYNTNLSLKSKNDHNLTITISSFFLMCLAMLLSDVMGIRLNMRRYYLVTFILQIFK